MAEEVIELSISETQALRAKLGLPPLRGVPSSSSSGDANGGASGDGDSTNNSQSSGATKNDNEISLSIDETNELRRKIGLPPLKTSKDQQKKEGSSASTAIHAPPTHTSQSEHETKKRLEDMAAKREAAERIRKLARENDKAGGGAKEESAADFAAKMLRGKSKSSVAAADENENGEGEDAPIKKKKKKKGKKKLLMSANPQLSLPNDDEEEEVEQSAGAEYTSADLHGIKVSHATSDFTAGSTTILTLADKSILDVDPDSKKVTGFGNDEDANELVNVNMDSDSKALSNLKRKRQIELGAGRAGGYAGYDDDEFEELGGVGTSGPMARSLNGGAGEGGGGKATRRGFAIGADGTAKGVDDEESNKKKSDIFSSFSGGAISLQSRHGNKTVASDFLTHDDDDAEGGESKEERLEKERKKQMKLLEKLRKKDKKKAKKAAKKNKKSGKRSVLSDEEEEENVGAAAGGGNSLLSALEASAVDVGNGKRKRRRHGGSVDENAMDIDKKDDQTTKDTENGEDDEVDDAMAKRKRFDQIMEKGKVRTDRAFNKKPIASIKTAAAAHEDEGNDNDEDDAFLNAALAKARRLKRLKEMSAGAAAGSGGIAADTVQSMPKGEDAVVLAVAKIKREEEAAAAKGDESAKENGGITFEFDEMQEFTRALRAREDQAKRLASSGAADGKGKGGPRGVKLTTAKKEVKSEMDHSETAVQGENVEVEDVDMQELAQEMKDDDDNDNPNNQSSGMAFGSTAESAPIGRGMSSFLSLLKQTGEITKHSGKEEMRGRAKDKRTYEDYDNLDLKKVVTINEGQRGRGSMGDDVHEKDREFATREIKLEYRDEHGRLLTRKEAYRNMCYQFHGHGSSKKNQERRLKQIEREREEAKVASGRGGTLGALRATQEATGKAFVIHKT